LLNQKYTINFHSNKQCLLSHIQGQAVPNLLLFLPYLILNVFAESLIQMIGINFQEIFSYISPWMLILLLQEIYLWMTLKNL